MQDCESVSFLKVFIFVYLLSVYFCKLLAPISQWDCFHCVFVLCLALEGNFFSELVDYISSGRFHFTKCRCLMCRCLIWHIIPGSLDSHFRKRSLFLCKVRTWSDILKLDTSIQLMSYKINMHLHLLIFSHKSSQIPWPISIVFDLVQSYFFKHPRNW